MSKRDSEVSRHRLLRRVIRLGLAGLVAAVVCISYFLVFDQRQIYLTYRCLTSVQPWYGCYLHRDLNFRANFFGMTYEGNTKNEVDRAILKFGAYEKQELYFLRAASRGGIFLDVGANTGQHSMFMSRYAREVHAFEPYQKVLIRFRHMIAINRLTNIFIHPIGLGDQDRMLTFYEPPESNLGTGSFVPGWNGADAHTEKLAIVRGDDELKRLGIVGVDLIKIDIEGFEKQTLKGLMKTLKRDRPIVVFELSLNQKDPVRFKSEADVRAVFPRDYRFLAFKSWDFYSGYYELIEWNRIVRFDRERQYNVVAYPIEREPEVPRTPASSTHIGQRNSGTNPVKRKTIPTKPPTPRPRMDGG